MLEEKVVIANRGEIALRILRACHALGIRTVAVHSTVDRNLEARRDGRRVGVHRPGAVARELPQHAGDHRRRRGNRRPGHPPGYGFLSENADFAERVEQSGLCSSARRPTPSA